MTKQWIIRPYQEGDEERILSLFSANFPERSFRNKDWWHWRYKSNPAGKAIIYVAEFEDQLIGHLAYIPLRMKFFAQEMIGGSIGDSMVSAQYRKKGIRIKLREAVINEAKRRNWLIAIGFPNKIAYSGAIKYGGYIDACKITNFAKALHLKSPSLLINNKIASKIVHRFLLILDPIYSHFFLRFSGDRSTNEIFEIREKKIGSNFDHFWEEISRHVRIASVRDSKYLKWRYIDHPSFQYTIFSAQKEKQIIGYAVLKSIIKKNVNVGQIVDFLVLPENRKIAKILLDRVQMFFYKENIEFVSIGLKNDLGLISLFIKNGFLPSNKQKVIARVFMNSEWGRGLSNQRNWLLSYGDLDGT